MHYNNYAPYQEPMGGYSKRGRGERSRYHQTGYGHNPGQNYPQYQNQSQGYNREPDYHNQQHQHQPQPQSYRYEEDMPENNGYGDQTYGDQASEKDQQKPPRKIQLFIGGIPPNVNESNFLLLHRNVQKLLRELRPDVRVQNGDRQSYE